MSIQSEGHSSLSQYTRRGIFPAVMPHPGLDLTGYRVETSDGHIGRVDKHSEEVDSSHVVVDTGPWI